MGESIFDEKAENGIVGIFNFADGFDFSEYLEIKLTDSLKHGLFYQLSVDLKASYPFYACDAIDFLFTKDSIFEPALFNYGKFPQVSNPKGNIIADSTNWFTLVDTFRAEGGEKFMTIGSFRLGDSTVWSQGALLGSGQSYVLIDNIKLVEYVPDTPLPETPLPFNLFPNPNNGQFTVTYTLDTSKYHQLIFYNTIGQLVYSYELNPAFYSAGLDLSALSGGMYLYTLVSDGKRARSGKMVVVK